MKYIVYLTKNIINSHIYIGVHKTEDPDVWDYYLGDGCYANKPSSYNHCNVPFAAAVHKYGPKNFRRTTLKIFNTLDEALRLEAILVDEHFIRRKDTYNITLGGGVPPVLNKKVFQYDLNGVFVKEWFSIIEVTTNLHLWNGAIRKAVNEKQSCANYYWTFDFVESLNISEYRLTKYKTHLLVYNRDKLLLNEFSSVVEAGQFYDIDPKAISSCIYDNSFCQGLIFLPVTKTLDDFFKAIENRKFVCKTKIYKYDLHSGNYLDEYESIADAKNDVGLKSHAPIIRAAKTGKTSSGFRWSYFKVDNILNNPSQDVPSKPKKIAQYTLDNNLVKIWDINECRKLYPNCVKVCRGARNKAYNYVWKYIDN